jgi:hypothetical protein
VGGDDEGAEVGELGGVVGRGGALFAEDVLEDVGVVRDDAVDAEGDEFAHLVGGVGGPGDDAKAGSVKGIDVDRGCWAEEGGIERGEDGSDLHAVGEGVRTGGGHQGEEGIERGCERRGLLGHHELRCEEESDGERKIREFAH